MNRRILTDGYHVVAVYDDALMPLLRGLGHVRVERATDVEFDEATQEWVATLRATGSVIAHGPNRADVIRAEIVLLNAALPGECNAPAK